MKKTWTNEEAEQILEKIEAEFEIHFTAIQDLAKSEKEEKDEEKEDLDKCGDMKKASEEAEESEKEEKDEEKEEELEKAEDLDVEGLYKSMSSNERDFHYKALKKVMGVEKMEKSESLQEVTLAKSELQAVKETNEELKKQNEELKKSMNGIIQALESRFVKKASVPKQKAVTELAVLSKSEETAKEPSVQEIKAKLVEQVKSNKLSKSETNEVLAYFNGTVDLSKVKHLLNK